MAEIIYSIVVDIFEVLPTILFIAGVSIFSWTFVETEDVNSKRKEEMEKVKMISASEAKRKSIVNSKGKEYLNKLENRINDAIKDGNRSAMISIDLIEPSGGKFALNKEPEEIRTAIVGELTSLGYRVNFKYADPLPALCPSDQWNFDNGYIKVEW